MFSYYYFTFLQKFYANELEKEPENTSSGKNNVVKTGDTEKTGDSDDSTNGDAAAQTGDASAILLWAVLAFISIAGIVSIRQKQN